MPPIQLPPLRKLAAPSPSVLNFLRSQVHNAFESSAAAPCAFARGRDFRNLSTGIRGGQLDTGSRSRGNGDTGRGIGAGKAGSRNYTSSRHTHVDTRRQCLALEPYSKLNSASSTSLHLAFPHNRHRAFSTTSSNKWSLFGAKKPSRPPPQTLDYETDDRGSFNSLGRHMRSANELKMRCTELDENGHVTMVSGEFKKTELTAKYGLLPRDLRKIDSSLLPHILVRPSAILINLLHLRVLIKHNRVLVFDAYGTTDSKSQSVFMYDLDLKLRQKESPANGTLAYEFRALEAVLISVTMGLEKELEGVSQPVVKVLMELEENIDRDNLRYLLIYSKKLGTFEQKARLVRDSLTELLEADDDLSAMYLSEKAEGKIREDDDHTEVEMLLESYHKVADEIVQAAENLVSSIRNTEEIIKAILDSNRNSLMLLDLKFSIFTLALTAGTFIAALYGMNLKNMMEESDYAFWGISGWCGILGIGVMLWGLKRLRRVQRVSMWGHSDTIRSGKRRDSGGWGLGAWGGGNGIGRGVEEGFGAPRLRPGESLGDLIQRERAVARRLATAEARAEEFGK